MVEEGFAIFRMEIRLYGAFTSNLGFSLGCQLVGGFLTTGYCSRLIGYCFPYCFVGGQGCDEGRVSRDRGNTPVSLLEKVLKPEWLAKLF